MTEPPVVLDTMVLLRALTEKIPYVDVLQKIMKTCNKIVFSTPLLKEWRSKAYVEGMTILIMLRKLEELRQNKKLKKCGRTSIEKARKLIIRKKCKTPVDSDDLKFVHVALAEAAILITEDRHLLDLNLYNCGNANLKITSPNDYISDS